ncbi:unnamed protein product, partial [Phaeothamnion confervicola]
QLRESVGKAVPPDLFKLETTKKPHVIILSVESFRWDSLQDNMPKLAKWATRGLVLRHHYTGSNTTAFGIFAILSGRNPIFFRRDLAAHEPTQLVATLKASGYQTTFMSGTNLWGWRWIERMCEAFDKVDMSNEEGSSWLDWSERDRSYFAKIKQAVTSNATPQMLFLQVNSTHYPYAYPPSFNLHEPSGQHGTENQVNMQNWDMLDRSLLRNRNLNSLAYLDSLLDDLFSSIDLNNTLIVLTGDHGESLGEDGTLAHGSKASEAQFRTPCLLLGAGISPGSLETFTSHLDLVPTILHALGGKPVALRGSQGRDLLASPPTTNRLALYPNRPSPPFEIVLVDGESKLEIRLSQRLSRQMDMGPDGSE